MDAAQKAAVFDDMVGQVCAFGDALFEGTNGRLVVIGWVGGHCDSVNGLSLSVTPESRAEMRQALAFAAQYARDIEGERA